MNAAGMSLLPIAAPAAPATESAGLPVDSAEAGAFMALLVQAMPQPATPDAVLPMIPLDPESGNLPLAMIEEIEWIPDPETLNLPELLFDPVPVPLPAGTRACEEAETPLLEFSEAVTTVIDPTESDPPPTPRGATPSRSPSPFPQALASKPFPPRAVPSETPSPRAVRSETPPPRAVPSELPSPRAAAPRVHTTSEGASETASPRETAPSRPTKREAEEQVPDSAPDGGPPAIVLPEVAVPLTGGAVQVRVSHPEAPLVRRPSIDGARLAPTAVNPPKAPAIPALPVLSALQALSTLRALREMSGPAAPVSPKVALERESGPDSPPTIAEKSSPTVKAVELVLDGMLALTEQSRPATHRQALRDARPDFQPAAPAPEKGMVIKELVVAVSEEAPAPARRHTASAPAVADPVVPVPSVPAQPAGFDSASRERAGSDSITSAESSNTAPPASPRKPLAAAPGNHVTLEVENGGDDRARIRVSVQGGVVRATVLSNAELGTRLSDHVDELRRALADRGFHETTLTLQRAEAPAATATLPERDGGHHQGGRQSKNRDDNPYYGPRYKPADDRPRQYRRPEPEEKE
jgi:hypothetical protein